MDKNHRLDAPNNEALSDIEQIEDHTRLAATYPTARSEWDGIELMSGEARAKKRDEEQIRINAAIWKWFPIIGLLIPMPAVLLAPMLALAATHLDIKDAGILLLPVFFAVGLWGYLSFKSIRAVHSIFYAHSIKTTPYLFAHVILLGLSFRGLFLLAQSLHSGWAIGDVLIVDAIILTTSILLAGILLFIWTTRRLTSNWKIGILAMIACAVIAIQVVYAAL